MSFGQSYDPLAMPEAARSAYDDVIERAEDLIEGARRAIPNLPPIHFDLIVDGNINAFAFRANDRYFIGLNTGTLYMLRLVIGRMLADPSLFPSVGDPSEESSDVPLIGEYLPDAVRMNRANEIITPLNAIRRSYASFLQDQALMFFVGHEITHIAHGHVDYLQAAHGFAHLSELSDSSPKDEEVLLERQSMEQDADRRSIISRIDSLRVTYSKQGDGALPWAADQKGPERLIRDWSVSIGIVFRLFGDVQFSREKLRHAAYPPFPLRRLYAEGIAGWQIETAWDPALRQAAIRGLHTGRMETDHAFATILGKADNDDQPDPESLQADIRHLMDVQDYWNSTMVEKMRPFSYAF